MAGLDPRDLHINKYLTGILVGYRPQGMIADQIYPVIPVQKQTDAYATVERGNWFRRPTTLRSPGARPREVSFTVGSGQYVCVNYALSTVLPYETIDNADDPHDPMARAGEFLMDQMAIDYEMRVRAQVVSNVGSSISRTSGSTSAWDDFANSDPIGDLEIASEAIRVKTGYRPNVMVIGYRAWLKMRRHPDIVKISSPGGSAGVGGLVTPQDLGNVINIDKVLVPEPIVNTAEEGQADTFTDVWSTDVTVAYVTPRPGLMVPTYGYTFRWTGPNIGNASPGNLGVYTARDEIRKVVYMQTGYYQDERLVASELGFNIKTGIV